MGRARSITRNTVRILGGAMLVALSSASALAVPSIDLSLNVLYANPANPVSGGNWELVAKTNADGFGLAGLSALVTNIATAVNTAPRGFVNGTDPAGFAFLTNTPDPSGFRNLTLGQVQALGAEQSAFYGVGTLTNGAPNYPMKPVGSNSIGPAFTTLTNVNGVAWAATNTFNDPAWVTAAKLATGTFAAGVTPAFYANGPDVSRGNVFTSLGTSMAFGAITPESIVATTIVRTNFVATPSNGDYNHNGIVDAADYIVWRNTLGLTSPLDADGDGSGTIDDGDYTVWRMKFGNVIGPGSGAALGASTVPEPAAATLLAIGATFLLRRTRRPLRRSRLSASQKSAPGKPAADFGEPAFPGLSLPKSAGGTRGGTHGGTPAGTPLPTPAAQNSGQTAARPTQHRTIFRQFSGRFSQLLNSCEKRLIEGGNCLTASKTGNIMPKGSRAAGVSTSWGHLSGRPNCASCSRHTPCAVATAKTFLGNAHRGCAGQKQK